MTLVPNLHAQFQSQFGIEFGINLCDITNQKFPELTNLKTQSTTGIIAGIYIETIVTSTFSVIPLSVRYI